MRDTHPQTAGRRALRFVALILASGLMMVPDANADAPAWSVTPSAYAATMTLVIEVRATDVQTPGQDQLAVFVSDPVSGLDVVRGVSSAVVTRGQVRHFLTVYANTNGETLTFKYYNAITDQVYIVDEALTFVANRATGSVNAPVRMTATAPERGVPAWQVDVAAFAASMTAVARLTVEGVSATIQDALAAFVGDEVRGVAMPVDVNGVTLFFMTAYANATTDTLTFRLYDASRDEVIPVGGHMVFEPNATYGSTATPLGWVASVLEAPALLLPQDGTLAPSATLDLSWASIAGGAVYDVQVATDASFATRVFEGEVETTEVALPPLAYSTRHYWRVRARGDGLEGLWSAPFQFETAGLLEAPVLHAPQDGVVIPPASPTLVWEPMARGTRYGVQVATDASFATRVFEGEVETTEVALPPLAYSTRYYWRVRARGDGLEGLWSAPFQFETAGLLEAPDLRAPQDGTVATSAKLALKWGGIAGGVRYDVQVATDVSFATRVFEGEVETTEVALPPLAYSTRYYWRVRARGDGLEGLWSAPFQFETATGVGVQERPRAVAFEVLPLYPNPTHDATTITYQLAQSTEVTIVVFDLLGRKVQTYESAARATGQHERHMDVSGLSPGRYVVHVRAGARQHSQLLSVY